MQTSEIGMNKALYFKAARGLIRLPLIMGALLFSAAWTFAYWEAWIFIAVFFACSLAITVYLAICDPNLLERRMRVGPTAETEPRQKLIMALATVLFAAMIVVPAIDHRLGWSHVPVSVVILGDALIVLGFAVVLLVFRENTYGAATIQVAENQTVVSTGPYALVRHPMYSGALLMMLGVPPALGSWWGLITFGPAVAGIAWRLLDEERFLSRNLPGYTAYRRKVRHRLLPLIW